jgi:hypothetical protein
LDGVADDFSIPSLDPGYAAPFNLSGPGVVAMNASYFRWTGTMLKCGISAATSIATAGRQPSDHSKRSEKIVTLMHQI